MLKEAKDTGVELARYLAGRRDRWRRQTGRVLNLVRREMAVSN
jgi:hypothetical protein